MPLPPCEKGDKGQGSISLRLHLPLHGWMPHTEGLQALAGPGASLFWQEGRAAAIHHFLWGFAGISLHLASQGYVLGLCSELGTRLNKHFLASPVLAPLLSQGHPYGWSRV